MARRFAVSFFAAFFLSLGVAWLLARWWPAAALDRALIVALLFPLIHLGLMLWLWFSLNTGQRWRRIIALGLSAALAISGSLFIAPQVANETSLASTLGQTGSRTQSTPQ